MYEIIFKQSSNNARYFNTGKIPVGHGTICGFLTPIYYLRPTESTVSGNTITFESTKVVSGGVTTEDNSYAIPLYVIGYNTNLF